MWDIKVILHTIHSQLIAVTANSQSTMKTTSILLMIVFSLLTAEHLDLWAAPAKLLEQSTTLDLPWKDPITNKQLHLFIQLMLLSKTGNITSNCQVNNSHISQRQVHSLNYNNINRSDRNNSVFKLTSKKKEKRQFVVRRQDVSLRSRVSFLVLNL